MPICIACSWSYFHLPKDHSLSEDIGAVEASDVLSAISNEECSVTSEILDKNSSINSHSHSHINAIEVIQVSGAQPELTNHLNGPHKNGNARLNCGFCCCTESGIGPAGAH